MFDRVLNVPLSGATDVENEYIFVVIIKITFLRRWNCVSPLYEIILLQERMRRTVDATPVSLSSVWIIFIVCIGVSTPPASRKGGGGECTRWSCCRIGYVWLLMLYWLPPLTLGSSSKWPIKVSFKVLIYKMSSWIASCSLFSF